MEFRQIHYFIEIAESKSLSGAVKKLYVAQPALSRSIKELESEIGAQLFTRSRKGMELTDAGRNFLTHAYAIMKQVDSARKSARESEENPDGEVSLGMLASVSNVLSVPVYQQTREKYSKIGLLLTEGMSHQLEAALDATSLDLIVDVEREDWHKYSEEKLIREELFLVGKKPVGTVAVDEICFEDAKKYLFAKTPKQHRMPQQVQDFFQRELTGRVNHDYYIDYHPAIKLILAGEGYIILPWSAIHDYVALGLLSGQRISDLHRTISLYTPLTRPTTLAMSKVIDIIKKSVKDVHKDGNWRGELLLS